MSVTFQNIPATLREPFAYFEVNAGASPYQSISRLLIIAQMTAGGTAIPNEPMLVTGNSSGLFGLGSQADMMYQAAYNTAPFQEIWVAPVADAVGSTAATAKIQVTGQFPVSTGGTIALYLGGQRIQVGVTTTDTAASVAANINAAINNSNSTLEATSIVNGSTVTEVDITARNKGTIGNSLHLAVNLNADDGPYGASLLTITDFAGGATDPSVSSVLANCAGDLYDFIVAPYSDTANVGLIAAFLSGRWLPTDGSFGAYVTFKPGSPGALQTYGAALNSENISVYGAYNFQTSIPVIAACIGARHASQLQSPPNLSLPLQTLTLPGVRGPKFTSDRFTATTNNTLLFSGISTLRFGSDGTVMIDRGITTYQKNAYSQIDTTWLSVNTRAQLMYGVRYMKAYVTNTFPRAALVDSNPANIQDFVTVDDIENAIVHAYSDLVTLGVFQDLETFKTLLVVERDASDPNRVNAYIPTDGVNQLNVFAGNVTAFTQFPTSG